MEVPPQAAGQLSCQGEPQSRSVVLPVEAGIELLEGLKEEVHVLGGNPYPRIPNNAANLLRLRGSVHLEADLSALWRELHGVHDEVHEDLAEPLLIRAQGSDLRARVPNDGHSRILRGGLHQADTENDHLFQGNGSQRERDRAALHLREI